MIWPVTIRNTDSIEDILRKDEKLVIPLEVAYNSIILMKTMDNAERVIPELKELEPDEWIKLNAVSAYLLRTDLVRDAINSLTVVPMYRGRLKENWPYGKLFQANPLNDPKELNEDWIPPWHGATSPSFSRYLPRSVEFSRCYLGSIGYNPKIKKKVYELDPKIPMTLGNIAAFLVNPMNLVDYTYTTEEIRDYNRRLILSIRDL